MKPIDNNLKYIVSKPKAGETIMFEVVLYSKDQKSYENIIKKLIALESKSKGILKISEKWRIPL